MNIKKYISILLLVYVVFVTSCSPSTPIPNNDLPEETADLSVYTDRKIAVDPDTTNKAYMGTDMAVYNNVLYLSGSLSIYKYMLTSSEKTLQPVPACPDALCKHNTKSCKLYIPTHDIFIIDEEASKLNNNAPIFYILYESAIKKYDSATNKLEVIYDPSSILSTSLWMCNDKLYLTYSTHTEHFLARLDKDGSNLKVLSRENSDISCRIVGIYDDFVYYSDSTNAVYKGDFDADKEEFLFRTDCGFGGEICDGYLYYGDKKEISTYENSNYMTCSLYRVNLNETGMIQPELIDTNLVHSLVPFIYSYEGNIVYCKRNMIKKGEVEYKVNNETKIKSIFSYGTNKMYRYDPQSKKIDIAFEDSGYNLRIFGYMDDQFFISRVTTYEFDENGKQIEAPDILFYDYTNDTEQYLEYPVFVRPEGN